MRIFYAIYYRIYYKILSVITHKRLNIIFKGKLKKYKPSSLLTSFLAYSNKFYSI